MGGGVGAADLCNAEDGLPAVQAAVALGNAGVAEAGGDEGALGPAVVDGGEMPVDDRGGGVSVELVADVDQLLD